MLNERQANDTNDNKIFYDMTITYSRKKAQTGTYHNSQHGVVH